MSLPETEHYIIRVGNAVGAGEGVTQSIYHIINKEYNVIEYEDAILPRTIESLYNLQELLYTTIAEANKPANKPGEVKVVSLDAKPH